MNRRDDIDIMKLAFSLAEKGKATAQPNPMVGAVIVNKNEIAGEGYHERFGEEHAEIMAIRQAGDRAKGGTLYVTLEPCCHHGKTPPCTKAIVEAGLSRVVCSDRDPNPIVNGAGLRILEDNGVSVEEGVMSSKARRLNEKYYKYITTGRPFVTLKMAQSLDGHITYSGSVKWVTGMMARRRVHGMRASHMSIMAGIGTVEADDPALNVRYGEYTSTCRQPLRVIIDSNLRLKSSTTVVSTAQEHPVAVYTHKDPDGQKFSKLSERGVQIIIAPADNDGRLDLRWILEDLGSKNISSVLVEGGRALATSLINEQLVDKVVLFVAPRIIGEDEGIEGFGKIKSIDGIPGIELKDIRFERIDCDLMVTGYPEKVED
jgi:diaminohydroxyphosphoribosylaminopyrimidine deaminase/5-amino-6-(5-phosphoribosylamino)uracil reductase